ncbi:c-type cytochrome [Algicella marina]|nr:cytochrome c [Algicella marina]
MPASHLKTATLATLALALTVSMPLAGGHSPVEKRQEAMKTMGRSAKTIGDMLKGTTVFDAATANQTLATMQSAASGFGDYFPEGSEAADSEAAPAIWSDKAGFEATLADFQSDLASAVAAAPQDQAALGAVFKEVGANCGVCHKAYRVKK